MKAQLNMELPFLMGSTTSELNGGYLILILENAIYFSAQGSLHRCSLKTKASELVVDNSTSHPTSNVNNISVFRKTDTENRQVKEYNPEKNTVIVVIGSGQEKNSDGSEKSASFVQVHAICTYEKSLFVTDVAAGTIRLVTSLSKRAAFLKNLMTLFEYTKEARLRKRYH